MVVEYLLSRMRSWFVLYENLKVEKAPDTNGIAVEMLKESFRQALRKFFNDIVADGVTTPQQWKHIQISVIFKSGEPALPQNYRPISIIPLMYKLFSRLLYNRLEPILDAKQPPSQAGFRRHFSTDDHLLTFAIVQEKSKEFQLPFWVATLDFKKAFDTVSHQSLWKALRAHGVPEAYIDLIAHMYADQTACVKTDVRSKTFTISRGTKQGDPLSSLLFNCLSEFVFNQFQTKWADRRYGIHLAVHEHGGLTDLRFADDVLLLATSLKQLKSMISDVIGAAQPTGLEIHPGKTKILHNVRTRRPRNRPEHVVINGNNIEVLPFSATQKYLGRLVTFSEPTTTEVEARIKAAWKKFGVFKQELTTRSYSLKDRLRLFNGTVAPTLLYGSGSWTMTISLESRVRSTQRQMLRMVLGSPRRRGPEAAEEEQLCDGTYTTADSDSDSSDAGTSTSSTTTASSLCTSAGSLEPWVDWIKRTTRHIEGYCHDMGYEDWCTRQRRLQWRLFVATINEDVGKWSRKALLWDPTTTSTRAKRLPHRPNKRWLDDIAKFIHAASGEDWQSIAPDSIRWSQMEEPYVQRQRQSRGE